MDEPLQIGEDDHGEHQQAAGENDRHDAGLVDLERHVVLGAAEHAAAANVLGALHRDAPLAERDKHDARDNGHEHRRQHDEAFDAELAAGTAEFERGLLAATDSRRTACGPRMPAMISRLMPLPMPNSSICSPSHIRKIVPAVIVSTVAIFQYQMRLPALFWKSAAHEALRLDVGR